MQRKPAAVVLLLVVGGLVLSGALGGTADDPAAEGVSAESLIAVEGEHDLWPYTSRRRSVSGRTLAINVVFRDDAGTVRAALTGDGGSTWEVTDDAEREADGDLVADVVGREWRDAYGSTRYSYFEGADGGEWTTVTFEVHDGAYLGSRDHVRAYESPDAAYTAVQVHEEYYDWFRLRHTVSSIDDPAVRLEDDFIDAPVSAEVRREYRGIDGGRSDGWLSVIEVAVLLPLAGTLVRRRTREALAEAARRLRREAGRRARVAVLGGMLAGAFLAVRTTGVALELAYPGVPPKAIAAPLYLVIAVGLPALVAVGARRSDPAAAFLGVTAGLGAGFVLDFAALGVAVPPGLIVHRAAVLVALGLLAAGRAAEDRPVLVSGVIAWLVGLFLPLAGVI
jgi:hypothetical protein